MKANKLFSTALSILFISSLICTPNPVMAHTNYGAIHAFPDTDAVFGEGWVFDSAVTFEVDDPATPTNPDVVQTVMIGYSGYPSCTTCFAYTLANYDLKEGDIITATDGITTKQLVVDGFNITGYDFSGDKVFGTAQPGQSIEISISPAGHGVYRFITADLAGNWVADFSVVGDEPGEQETADLRKGGYVDFQIIDEDNDLTVFWYYIPDPYIAVNPGEDTIESWGWNNRQVLSLEIEDLTTPISPDYSASKTKPQDGWPYPLYDLTGIFDIKPGQIVTLNDGIMSKEITVSSITVTNVDMEADTIAGTATPGSYVRVGNENDKDPNCYNRSLTTDQFGNWLADFSVEAVDQASCGRIADFTFDMGGSAVENDGDADITVVYWNIPDVAIETWLNTNRLTGEGWPTGSTLNVEVDDPSTSESPDFSKTIITEPTQWNPNRGVFDFNTDGYDVKPGDIYSVTDGTYTKSLTVANLAITDYDLATGLIYGTASPNLEVQIVTGYDAIWYNRWETADADGNWSTNFSIPGELEEEQSTIDIAQGLFLGVYERDEDNDRSFVGFPVKTTKIEVDLTGDNIVGRGWSANAAINITIDDPETPENPDYTGSASTGSTEWGPRDCEFSLNLSDVFDIKAGFNVIVSAGEITKDLVTSNMAATGFDPNLDVISGTSDPSLSIKVRIDNSEIELDVTSDSEGNWTADFSGLYDLTFGTGGSLQTIDNDGDITNVGWYLPYPYLIIHPEIDQIDINEWPLTSNVTISIGDPAQPEYTTIITENPPDQDHGGTWFLLDLANVIDLQPGQIVTAAVGDFTKKVVIANNALTSIDAAADAITGITEPGIVSVSSWVWDDSGDAASREIEVIEGNPWMIDFSIPGDQEWETALFDIHPDTYGEITLLEVDRDGTQYGWVYTENRQPVIEILDVPTTPVKVKHSFTAGVTFTDPDEGDSHTITFDWGDGTDPSSGSETVASHAYTKAGLYLITVWVTDAAGASDTKTSSYMIIYDTKAGSIEGDGQIVSPTGAYMANPSLTGKLTFEFEAAYKKNASIPRGSVEFNFKPAHLKFSSTSLDWMIVSGKTAILQGSGKVNGHGNYGFFINMVDGRPDLLRIKIWNKATGSVVYDSQPGEDISAAPSVTLRKGSIKISH